MSKVQRTDIYHKYGGRCAYCGRIIALEDMQIDHLVPKYRTLSDADLREKAIKMLGVKEYLRRRIEFGFAGGYPFTLER